MQPNFPDWRNTGGSSRFTEAAHDLRPFFNSRYGVDGIPLGINQPGGSTGAVWSTTYNEGHALLFAPNGTGKGANTIIPALLTYGGCMGVVDVKGENCAATWERRQQMGHRTVLFDPWGEVKRRYETDGRPSIRPTRFNPLSFIDPTSKSFAEDVAAISDATLVTHPGENPHWPDSARQFFGGCVALAKELYGGKATLRHVRNFMTASVEDILAAVLLAQKRNPQSLAVRMLRRFTAETEEISAVRSTALTQTAFLDNDELLDAMENDSPVFDLDDFGAKPITIYIVLPADKLVTYGRWMRIIIALMLRAVARAPRPPAVPSMIVVDEMGTIGPLRTLEAAYGLLRSYGVRLMGCYQSLGQMKGDYPTTWQNLINNCSVLQLLAVRDLETATYFSELLGTTTLYKGCLESALEAVQGFNAGNPGAGLIRKPHGSRPVMFPHELSAMLGSNPRALERNTQLIIYPQGGYNVLTFQNPYFREHRWKGWYRSAPIHAAAPHPSLRNHGGGQSFFDRMFGR